MLRRGRVLLALVLAGATLAGAPARAASPAPPFTQCPAIGDDTGCALLIDFAADGSVQMLDDPSQGPYDGVEDTLIGVQNDSLVTRGSVNLASAIDAFGFDGDGICSGFAGAPADCPLGPTGYEGPNTSFTNICADLTCGTVEFPNGLAPGATTYFSLEEHITASDLCSLAISDAISRPQAGHLYVNDADRGASRDGSTVLDGGSITVAATSSDPTNTEEIDFQIDGAQVATATADPYTATIPVPADPGPHTLTAIAVQKSGTACKATASLDLLVAQPSVKGAAEGAYAVVNVPVEPQVHAGGARVEGSGGSDATDVVDQPFPLPGSSIGAVHDSATGSTGDTLTSGSDSVVQNVSLLGGMVTARSLHAHAESVLDTSTLSSTTSAQGTEIDGLEIAGVPVPAPLPNTNVALPNGMGHVVLDERIDDTGPSSAELTVNALHLFIDTPTLKAELILGSAYAGTNLVTDSFAGPRDMIHRADDAGTGRDAGDTLDDAAPLQPGVYGAGFGDGDTTDYYSFSAGQGDRIAIVAHTSVRDAAHVGALPAATTDPTALLHGAADGIQPGSPEVNLVQVSLFDPSGALRARGVVGEAIEFNADVPYAPAGAKGDWRIAVTSDRPTFYTLALNVSPVALLSDDGGGTGDAPDTCGAARAVTTVAGPNGTLASAFTGVVRDADLADFYSFPATAGAQLTIAVKADELAGMDVQVALFAPATDGGVADCTDLLSTGLGLGSAQAITVPVPTSGTYVLLIRRVDTVGNYYVTIGATTPPQR